MSKMQSTNPGKGYDGKFGFQQVTRMKAVGIPK